jgi:lantibiotic modifying enzyme
LASAEFLDDGALDTEIDAAIRTTYRDGFRGGHSLCHGSLGNLELLHVAARRAASPLLKMFVLDFATTVLNEAERDGWRCGNPAGVESPGLMTGLAGIGYQLLRLAEPALVPSLLSFEAPIGAPPAARACR